MHKNNIFKYFNFTSQNLSMDFISMTKQFLPKSMKIISLEMSVYGLVSKTLLTIL